MFTIEHHRFTDMTFQLAEKLLTINLLPIRFPDNFLIFSISKILAGILKINENQKRNKLWQPNETIRKEKKVERGISDKDRKKPIKFGRNLPRSGSEKTIKTLRNQQEPSIAVHKNRLT